MKTTQEILNEIKIKLDKDFSTYFSIESDISIHIYNVYYYIFVRSVNHEFWNRLIKNNLTIYEIYSLDDLITLKIYVDDIRKLLKVIK